MSISRWIRTKGPLWLMEGLAVSGSSLVGPGLQFMHMHWQPCCATCLTKTQVGKSLMLPTGWVSLAYTWLMGPLSLVSPRSVQLLYCFILLLQYLLKLLIGPKTLQKFYVCKNQQRHWTCVNVKGFFSSNFKFKCLKWWSSVFFLLTKLDSFLEFVINKNCCFTTVKYAFWCECIFKINFNM